MKKQSDFFKLNREFAPGRIAHGDDSCIGRRKIARPIRRHCPIHIVLKSEIVKSRLSLLTGANKLAVDRIFTEQSRKFAVKIHSLQNVGNHIYAIASAGRRESLSHFLRAVAGLIARAILPEGKGTFWTKPPFTRLRMGPRDFKMMQNYIKKNWVEATAGKAARTHLEKQESAIRKQRSRELARKRRTAARSSAADCSAFFRRSPDLC